MRFYPSFFCFLLLPLLDSADEYGNGSHSIIKIGLVLDPKSPIDAVVNSSMYMALTDFYSSHSDYRTKLVLHTVDVDTQLDALSAVLHLLNTEGVQGIVGSEVSTEAFVAELANKAHVPFISFTQGSLSKVQTASPYTVQITPDIAYQVQAIVSICEEFKWHEVVILYEDNKYGNQFNSQLIKALREVFIRIAYIISLPPSAQEHEISTQFEMLNSIQTRVILVHLSTSLRSHIFHLAKELGMLSEEYAWVFTTESLSNSLSSKDSTFNSSWESVVGIRPYVPKSDNLENFKARWKRNMFLASHKETVTELNVYGLWAYDTIWALTMGIERIYETMDGNYIKVFNGKNSSDVMLNLTFNFSNVKASKFGMKLMNEMLGIKFTGLSGYFKLVDYQLRSSAFEIYSVIGNREKTLGYWLPRKGISRGLDSNSEKEQNNNVLWPRDSLSKPKGWGVPRTGKLRVGLPRKDGFSEFVKVEMNSSTNETTVSGFSVDVFHCVLDNLAVKLDYEFLPFVNESGTSLENYNHLLHKVAQKEYDIVVGDTTILADRAAYVDFTLPYTESGVGMVVKFNYQKNVWLFLKPLKWDLWAMAVASCTFIGLVVWILEHRILEEKSADLFMSTGLSRNCSRSIFIIWMFGVLFLTSRYTASLSAMLTMDRPNDFKFSEESYIGYQQGSFVREFLVNKLRFNDSKLRGYTTIEQYHNAMAKGGKHGGIDAIFDEIPYMKLFLRRYGSQYKMIGPTYMPGGFGFAFPRGSPLVHDFSRAMLRLIQSENMSKIENKYFGAVGSSSGASQGMPSNFGACYLGALFTINVLLIALALPSVLKNVKIDPTKIKNEGVYFKEKT